MPVLGGPDDALWAPGAGEPDVRVGLLNGDDPGIDGPVVIELALITEGAGCGPALDDQVVSLLEAGEVLRGIDAAVQALDGGAAYEAGDDAAAGEAIQHGDLLRHAILPAIALALPLAAIVTRIFKTSLGEAELQDYAQIARARGFSRGRVLLREAMPNAAISTVTLAGVQVTFPIGGTVLVERIFSYEGIGNMAIDAMINRDLPLIQGLVLTFAVIFIALNLAIDLVNAWLDPRLQYG